METIIQKTQNNRILKVDQEKYQRDDLCCGIKECEICPNAYENGKFTIKDKISKEYQEVLKRCQNKEFYDKQTDNRLVQWLPDTSVFLARTESIENLQLRMILLRTVQQIQSSRYSRTYNKQNQWLLTQDENDIKNSMIDTQDTEDYSKACQIFTFDDTFYRGVQQTQFDDINNYKELINLYTNKLKYYENAIQDIMNTDVDIETGTENSDSDTDTDDDRDENNSYRDRMLDSNTNSNEITESFYTLHEDNAFKYINSKNTITEETLTKEQIVQQNCAQWYERHQGNRICIVILSFANNFVEYCRQQNIVSITLPELLETISLIPSSLSSSLTPSLLQQVKDETLRYNKIIENKSKTSYYEPHLSDEDIYHGQESGVLLSGIFTIQHNYWSQGTVMVNSQQYLIPDFISMNRAIDGDEVIIKLLPESEWKAPVYDLPVPDEISTYNQIEEKDTTILNTIREDMKIDDVDIIEEEENTIKNKDENTKIPTGKVVGILRRKQITIGGYQDPYINKNIQNQYVFFYPTNTNIPKMLIHTKNITNYIDQRLIACFDSWKQTSKYPYGHITQVLGTIGDIESETKTLQFENNIIYKEWSKEILDSQPDDKYRVEDDIKDRIDQRNQPICSIDPPGCTDIDDAQHCIQQDDGNYEVGVHIADVTHYIKPDTPLDKEAQNRSTSVYLIDRRIDMIPARLSTDLCSLHQYVDRLAFSCVMKLSPNGDIYETKFFRSVIHNNAALTYEEAQARIDSEDTDTITQSCKNQMFQSRKQKAKRNENGALTLDGISVKFNMSKDRKKVQSLSKYPQILTHSQVEEFMQQANIQVAEILVHKYPSCAQQRRHPTPPENFWEPQLLVSKKQNIHIDTSSNKKQSQSLKDVSLKYDKQTCSLLRMLTIRCQTQAKYVTSGDVSHKQLHHFGLAASIYTHFTSPIRRYADIIVHRQLASYLGLIDLPSIYTNKTKMRKIITNMNERKQNADLASRKSSLLWIYIFFKNQPKPVQQYAKILEVRSTGIRVIVEKLGIEIPIVFSNYRYDEYKERYIVKYNHENLTLNVYDTIEQTKKEYTIFQTIMIRIFVDMNKRTKLQRFRAEVIDDGSEVIDPVILE